MSNWWTFRYWKFFIQLIIFLSKSVSLCDNRILNAIDVKLIFDKKSNISKNWLPDIHFHIGDLCLIFLVDTSISCYYRYGKYYLENKDVLLYQYKSE